jgi:hypothetical protein
MNAITTLNISIFSGPSFETARLIAANVSSTYNLTITVLNNTYILVAAYNSTATKNYVNLTYFTIPGRFNTSYLDALGYIPTYRVSGVEVDEGSEFYYMIGCVIGLLILLMMAIFLLWTTLSDCVRGKLRALAEKRRIDIIESSQWRLRQMKAKPMQSERTALRIETGEVAGGAPNMS